MYKSPTIKELEISSEEIVLKSIDTIFFDILNEIKLNLELAPYYKKIKIRIFKTYKPNYLKEKHIFKIGVNKEVQNKILIIKFNENYKKFIKFILLREIYNLFVPEELKSYKTVQIVINQIIMINLSKDPNLNQWREFIRGNLDYSDHLSKGFDQLSDIDRLEGYFRLQNMEHPHNPIKFFFHYLSKNISLISDNIVNINDLFLNEFMNYISKSMVNEEIVETIRCLIYIFYKVKRYKDLLSYKKYFNEFKEKGVLLTELSLRKFTGNMNWINKYSYIAPSYQLNWNAVNICVIVIFLRFNPIIKRDKIFKIVDNLPFFISPKISYNSFALDLCGYAVLPKVYLNDFVNFIKRLRNFNYIISYHCLLRTYQNHLINLNYFRENSQNKAVINPNHKTYKKNCEIEFIVNFGELFYRKELSILDYLVIDRIRHFNVSGFGFERGTEILNVLKLDLLNEIINQRTLIKNLKNILNSFYVDNDLKTEFLQFIDIYKKCGFFYLRKILEDYLIIISILEKIIIDDQYIKDFTKFHNFIKKQYESHQIEDNILLNNSILIKSIFREIVSLHSNSKDLFKKNVEKYKKFSKLIEASYSLKLFNLDVIIEIVSNQNLINSIYKVKEKKLKILYEKIKLYKIKTQDIDKIFDELLNNEPPIISPLLINTIITKEYVKDYLQLILTNSEETRKMLNIIKKFFPRILINKTRDLISNKNCYYIEIYTPYLNNREKKLFFSIIYNNFKNNLIYGKNYLWCGMIEALTSRYFYDFEDKKFFYTKDLFEHYFLFVQGVLGDKLKRLKEKKNETQTYLWANNKDLLKLVQKANKRFSRGNPDFNTSHLIKLLNFYLSLHENLLNDKKYLEIKQNYFFTNYVKSIKFIPAFQYFRLGKYFLYLYPSDINEIDFKLLLINTFQKIKFPASIDNSNSFFIKYIMPYGDPNNAYLNWLVKSKKVIREYCGFFIKKVYHLFQFNINITSEGWVYSPDRFKAHVQNILFNKDYDFQISDIKEFDLSDRKEFSHFGPNSLEYESLSNIYNWRPLNIKSYLGTLKYYPTENFTDLIKKGLIFPYLSLKNLGLQDKLYIIIPNLKKELNRTLTDIFSFFNYGFIYEIEGEYFIHGFPEEVKFKNGMMIKLYLPDCELSEFIRVFDLLFKYLEIKDYLILNDLVDGSNLLKSVFGGLKFLDSYNPLKNLIWNEKSRVWENHKLFTPKFEPIYPDLIEKE